MLIGFLINAGELSPELVVVQTKPDDECRAHQTAISRRQRMLFIWPLDEHTSFYLASLFLLELLGELEQSLAGIAHVIDKQNVGSLGKIPFEFTDDL